MNYSSVKLREEKVEINNHTEIDVFCTPMAMKDEGLTFLIKIFFLTVISSPGKMEGR